MFIRLVKTYYVSFTERAMISSKSPFTYILHKTKNGISENYIAKIVKMNERYILPSFDERDANTIKYSDILDLNQNNPSSSRLETLHRLINDIEKSLQ